MNKKKIYVTLILLIFIGVVCTLIDYSFGISASFISSENFLKDAYNFPAFIFLIALFFIGYIYGKIRKIKGTSFIVAIAVGVIYFGSVITTFFIYLPYHQADCRNTKNWDEFKACYVQKAKEQKNPMICGGMTYSETYFVVPPGGYRGHYSMFARSECFYKMAEFKNETKYCKYVVHPYREKCYKLDF